MILLAAPFKVAIPEISKASHRAHRKACCSGAGDGLINLLRVREPYQDRGDLGFHQRKLDGCLRKSLDLPINQPPYPARPFHIQGIIRSRRESLRTAFTHFSGSPKGPPSEHANREHPHLKFCGSVYELPIVHYTEATRHRMAGTGIKQIEIGLECIELAAFNKRTKGCGSPRPVKPK